jgi:hypothetical protein
MSRRVLVAAFPDEHALLGAVRALRAEGRDVLDVFGPHPVHGLDDALGLRPSRLPWVGLVCGLVGLAGGLALQAWTSATDWPLDVGGKPLLSWPAFVPVAFELTVLFAGLGTVAAFFLANRRAGRPPGAPDARPRWLDDRFAVVVGGGDATFVAAEIIEDLESRHGAVAFEEHLVEDPS